jgi:glycosyltransferase involved in cell wall biosynthesis
MRLVRSLSQQVGVVVQLVIVVEGSTDGTLEALATCGIPNLDVVHHATPRGVSAARNAGLARAEAEYVGFIDDDDFWSPHRAADAIQAMQSDPQEAAWSCCGAANIDGQMNVLDLQAPPVADTVGEDLYRRNSLPGGGSAVVARTELLRQAGGFSPEFTDLADWELWLRLIRLSPLAVVERYQIGYTFDLSTPSYSRATRSLEELTRLRALHRFGVDGNADFDPGVWNRWVLGHYWRAGNKLGMSRLWLREAIRTRSGMDLARSIACVLPMDQLLTMHARLRRRSVSKLDAAEAQTIERWLADIAAALSAPQ